MHLEVPWESLFGLKMKIYVEIPHSEQFLFYEKKIWSLMIFLTLFSKNPENCRKTRHNWFRIF